MMHPKHKWKPNNPEIYDKAEKQNDLFRNRLTINIFCGQKGII